MSLPALGSRKSTELLGEMMELCPEGQEANLFFCWAFTSRLPAWLHVQLAEEDYDQVRRLCKADCLWAAHGVWQQQAIAAATPLPDDSSDVFAVQSEEAAESWIKKDKRADSPAVMAQLESGLCLEHWLCGYKANRRACRRPCSWSKNKGAGGVLTPSPLAS